MRDRAALRWSPRTWYRPRRPKAVGRRRVDLRSVIEFDLHAHTTYSDGEPLEAMVEAAEAARLDAFGVSDHCVLIEDPFGRREQFDLVETYEERRRDVQAQRERTDLTLYEGAELSYVAGEEDDTRRFLEEAGFDYAIGSVHFAGGYDFTDPAAFVSLSTSERRAALDDYYETVIDMVESDLFDVVAHLDLPTRLPTFRGLTERDDYRRVAEALSDSRTVPELNAGRALRPEGALHPAPDALDVFCDREIEFTLGSDAHAPAEVTGRAPYLSGVVDGAGIDPMLPPALEE